MELYANIKAHGTIACHPSIINNAFMILPEIAWGYMKLHEIVWICMDLYRFLWICMISYGFV